jgi:hypothetical protein
MDFEHVFIISKYLCGAIFFTERRNTARTRKPEVCQLGGGEGTISGWGEGGRGEKMVVPPA